MFRFKFRIKNKTSDPKIDGKMCGKDIWVIIVPLIRFLHVHSSIPLEEFIYNYLITLSFYIIPKKGV